MADEVGRVSLGFELEGASLGKQINNVAKMAGDRIADVMKSSMRGMGKGMKDVVIPAPKVEQIDIASTQAEIEQLTAILDNTNAQIEFQTRKLSDLKQAYNETFNEADQNKLMGQILRTEASLLRLTNRSDSTAEKIWKLEDSLNRAGDAAEQVVQPVETIGQKMKKTNPQLTKSDKTLKSVAKSAGLAGVAMSTLGKKTTGMSNQFVKGFKRIAKQVLVFAVIYKAIRTLQNYIGSSLRTNDAYAKSLEQIKMNLKVAFSPIFQAILPALNALIKALVTATTHIATFTSALFGKTYKQSLQAAKGLDAARKSMDAYGKSAKKVGQSSIDELNLLDTSTDDGGFAADLAAFEMPDLDIDKIQSDVDRLVFGIGNSFAGMWERLKSTSRGLSDAIMPQFEMLSVKMQPVLEKWKESFREHFTDVAALGEPLKNFFRDGLVPAWENGVRVVGDIGVGLMDTLHNVYQSVRQIIMPVWESIFRDMLPILADVIVNAQDLFYELFNLTKMIFDDIWRDAIAPNMDLLSTVILDTLDSVASGWDEWNEEIGSKLETTLGNIKALWRDLWDSFLGPFLEDAMKSLHLLWDDHLKGLVDEIVNFVGILTNAGMDIWNEFIAPLVRRIVKVLGPHWKNTFNLILDIATSIIGAVSDILRGLIKSLGGLVDFIAGIFTLDFKRAWNGIKTFFEGIGDALVGVFKGAINIIIDALNFFIRQLNAIGFDIPEWVPKLGGKKFGFNIKEIPKLAEGGLVTAPTLAMVGDNPGANVDPEVVAPLSKLQDMLGGTNQAIIEVLLMILDAIRNQDSETVLQIGESEFGRLVTKAIRDYNRRAGRNLLLE